MIFKNIVIELFSADSAIPTINENKVLCLVSFDVPGVAKFKSVPAVNTHYKKLEIDLKFPLGFVFGQSIMTLEATHDFHKLKCLVEQVMTSDTKIVDGVKIIRTTLAIDKDHTI